METRRHSPPDKPCASRVCDKCVKLSSSRRELTIMETSDVLGLRKLDAKANVSETVSKGRHASC